MKRTIFLVVLLWGMHLISNAQDLAQIGKDKKPIRINGTLSATQIFAQSIGIPNRRPPYNYFLSGNVNIGIYGWSIPLSYTFSNQQSQFQQPFNQFGATPYYKWVKIFAGYSSMTFSNYTMNNHVFLGGGIQLTPGIFRFSAMYGRLNRAIKEDTSSSILPFYERMGMAFKIGIGKEKNSFDVVFLRAQDNISSIPQPLKQLILPGENVIISFLGSKSITKWVTLSGEYATSGYTNDIRSNATDQINKQIGKQLPSLVNRSSTSISNAYNIKLQYAKDGFTLGAGYERIDPEYKTMGAYFFNSDFENITANAGKTFLKGKLNINGSVGSQRSNLKGDKISGMSRNIYSINLSYSPSSILNFNSTYSNFQSVSRVRNQFDNVTTNTPQDTLRLNSLDFVQITQSANAGLNYTLGNTSSRTYKNSLRANITYQDVGNVGANNQRVSAGTKFYNSVVSFNRSIIPTNLSYSVSINSNINQTGSISTFLIGPTANISKSFFKKVLKTSGSISWINSYLQKYKINDIINIRLNASYLLLKKHQFSFTSSLLRRTNYQLPESASKLANFFEFSFNSGYSFTF